MKSLRDRLIILLLAAILLPVVVIGQEQPICAKCGQKIEGKYVLFEGKTYHESCYRAVLPRCAICGRPIEGNYTVFDDCAYHTACWKQNVALNCACCGGVIDRDHLVDFWGNHYHHWHEDQYPSCDFCGRLICPGVVDSGVQFDDDHFACNLCLEQAIDSRAEGQGLLNEVCQRLGRIGISIDCDDVVFELVSAEELARRSGDGVADNFGLARYEYEKVLGFTVNRKYTIYIRDGLPRMHFISTVAHELMHVWMYRQGREEVDPPLLEGSCNFAARLVLEGLGGPEAEYVVHAMDSSEDPVYGEGYRRVKSFVDDKGVEGWLDYLKDNRFFPARY